MSTAALLALALLSLVSLLGFHARMRLEWPQNSVANVDVLQWYHCNWSRWGKDCSESNSDADESLQSVLLNLDNSRRLRSNGDVHSSRVRSSSGDTKRAKSSSNSASSSVGKVHEHSSSRAAPAHIPPTSNVGSHGSSSTGTSATASAANGCLPPETVRQHHRPYFLAMGVVLRQEASFVEEWARFHLAEGVDHFYVIDQETTASLSSKHRFLSESTRNSRYADVNHHGNSSSSSVSDIGAISRSRRRTESSRESDDSSSVLAPVAVGQRMWYHPPSSAIKSDDSGTLLLGATATALEKALPGMTTHLLPPTFTALDKERSKAAVAKEASLKRTHLSVANMPAMLDSYHRIVAAAKNQATWLLLIDSDEFMYAASPSANVATTLKALVAKHPLAGQVSVPWEVFGSSGHLRQPQCQVASFTWRLPWSLHHGKAQLVKSIVRPDAIRSGHTKLSVHRTEKEALCPRWLSLSADGVPIDSDASPPTTAAKPFASGVPGVVSQPCAAASSASRESSSSSATSTTHGATGSPGATSSTTSSSKKQPHATGRTPPHNMDWPRPGSAMLRLNHYMYRSRDFALRVKACRALPAAGKSGKDVDAAGILTTLRDVDAATSVCDTYAAERQRYGVLLNPSKSPAPPPPAHAQCPPSLDDLSLLAATLQGSNRRLAHSSNSLSNHSSLGTGNSGNAGIDDFETSKSTSSPEFDSIQQEAHRRRATTAPTHLAAAAPSARQAAEARAWKAGLYADLGPGCGVPEPDPDSHVEQLIHKECGRTWASCPVRSKAAYQARGSFPLPPTAY